LQVSFQARLRIYFGVNEQRWNDLEELIGKARERGDECFAVLLEGVKMYVSLGREIDLLEAMRDFERELRPAVEGTPSAAELHRLYNRPEQSSGPAA
jgi:hypothetical protein